ncbi:MAG: hypothetical protein WDZ72_05865, partial [Cyclobacteriaceae bacterium]
AVDGFSVVDSLPLISEGTPKNEKVKPAVHIIGLGGAGTNILEHFHKKGIKGKYTSITNCERPHFHEEINFIRFLPPTMENKSGEENVWSNSDMSQSLDTPQEIKDLFDPNDQYFLLAGLGGYTGTNMVETLTTWLLKKDMNFVVICTLPFAFEGSSRNSYASEVVRKFRHLPNFKYFDLEAVMEVHGNNTIPVANEHFYSIFMENYENLKLEKLENSLKKRGGRF